MINNPFYPKLNNYFLHTGYLFVTPEPTIISTVLGSCVSVCLYDKKLEIGGMANIQLPYVKDKKKATSRYGNIAIPLLIRTFIKQGSNLKHMEAIILGGACNFAISSIDIGIKNISVIKKIILQNKINIASEDIGGKKGRKVIFNTQTNETVVMKVDRIRKGDWYPYKAKR